LHGWLAEVSDSDADRRRDEERRDRMLKELVHRLRVAWRRHRFSRRLTLCPAT
jgi:hypothetical protein